MKIEDDKRLIVSFRMPYSLVTKVKVLAAIKQIKLQEFCTDAVTKAIEAEADVIKTVKGL